MSLHVGLHTGIGRLNLNGGNVYREVRKVIGEIFERTTMKLRCAGVVRNAEVGPNVLVRFAQIGITRKNFLVHTRILVLDLSFVPLVVPLGLVLHASLVIFGLSRQALQLDKCLFVLNCKVVCNPRLRIEASRAISFVHHTRGRCCYGHACRS